MKKNRVIKFNSIKEIDNYFVPGKCGDMYWSPDKNIYLNKKDMETIKNGEFPVCMKVQYHGPDADSVGLGYQYKIVSKHDASKRKEEILKEIEALSQELKMLI